jgi:predicted nuclease with TOPRIM domain
MNPKELLIKLEKNLDSLGTEKVALRDKCVLQEIELEELKKKVTSMENEKSLLLTDKTDESNSIISPEKNKGVKLKIEGLIEEIDECLTLLNN